MGYSEIRIGYRLCYALVIINYTIAETTHVDTSMN